MDIAVYSVDIIIPKYPTRCNSFSERPAAAVRFRFPRPHGGADPWNNKHKSEKGGIFVGKDKSDAGNMPIGLMMSLAQHEKAMKAFGRMDDERQKSVIRYVEDSTTGEEAKSRIRKTVENLEQGNTGFLG